jgi:hypothetical protein
MVTNALNAFYGNYVRFWKVKTDGSKSGHVFDKPVIHLIINAILLIGVLWIFGRFLAGKD